MGVCQEYHISTLVLTFSKSSADDDIYDNFGASPFDGPSLPPPLLPPKAGAPLPPPPPPPPAHPKHPPRPSPRPVSASESTMVRMKGISFCPEPILKIRTSRAAALILPGGPPPPPAAPAPPPPPPKRVSIETLQAAPRVSKPRAMLFASKVSKSVKDKQRTVPPPPVRFARSDVPAHADFKSQEHVRGGPPPVAMAPPPPPPPPVGRGRDDNIK